MTDSHWEQLGAIDPSALGPARIAAHYAAQPIAATGRALVDPRGDDSHTNILWSQDRRAFLGRPLAGGHRLFLDVAELRCGLVAPDGSLAANESLAGTTLDGVFATTHSSLRTAHYDVPDGALVIPDYDLPASTLRDGAVFPEPDASSAELARWFANATAILESISAEHLGGVEVRGWPHHFDVAAFLELDGEPGSETARSINVGFSPGDGGIDEPYFYVTPWPAPSKESLPTLPDPASWHTEGFTAAVVRGSELVGADDQRAAALGALRGAIEASRSVLGH